MSALLTLCRSASLPLALSAPDRHLQRDRGRAGHGPECGGAERRHLGDAAGEPGVLHIQPAQQAPAHHPHHRPQRELRPAGGLPAGCRRLVTAQTRDRGAFFLKKKNFFTLIFFFFFHVNMFFFFPVSQRAI